LALRRSWSRAGTCTSRLAFDVGMAIGQAAAGNGSVLENLDPMSAVYQDIQMYLKTGDPRYKKLATWDAAWGAFALIGMLRNGAGCFTEDAQVSYFVAGSPIEHSGSIKELVSAWKSGADVSVRARDEVTGKEEICKVTNAWERTVSDVVTVEFADKVTGKVVEVLTGTLEHPFMTLGGWVGMGSLGIGTEILTRAGPRLVVKSVNCQHFANGVKVYNFTVDGKHTYFVGSTLGGIWVHNAICINSGDAKYDARWGRNLGNIINEAINGSFEKASGALGNQNAATYHANEHGWTDADVLRVLSDPDFIFRSGRNDNILVLRGGDVVTISVGGSQSGKVITGYGATGHQRNDPTKPGTPESEQSLLAAGNMRIWKK
jgi:Pretoxin HINT domain